MSVNLRYDCSYVGPTIDSALLGFLFRWFVLVGSHRLGALSYLFLQHALQSLLRLAVRERRHVVVICGQLEQPLRADLRHRTDVCSRREHKLVEDNPLRLGIETARGMQRYRLIRKRKGENACQWKVQATYLIVLHGNVGTFLPFFVRNLHKEPAHE